MAYYKRVMQPNEIVRLQGKLHWIVYKSAILLAILACITLPIWIGLGADLTSQSVVFLVVSLFCFLMAFVLFCDAYVRRHTTEIVVTNRRVLYKRGVFARHTMEMNVSKIETVDVEQTLLDRALGCGTVLIKGTGAGFEPLRNIRAPLDLRNALLVG